MFGTGDDVERDHPRVCGEHLSVPTYCDSFKGSSPRMRGAHPLKPERDAFPGIIPAYAGSTVFMVAPEKPIRDHPRVCGEHLKHQYWNEALTGSSPRMRGAPRHNQSRHQYRGIIPAYAGSTRYSREGSAQNRDHPRVCGEHTKKSQFRIP